MQSIGLGVYVVDHGSAPLTAIGRNTDRTSSKLRTLGRVGASVMRGLAGASLIGALALGGAAKAAADDQVSHRQLAVQLKNNTDATHDTIDAAEAWISKMGVQLGIADDDLRPALSRLATATGSVSKAQNLAKLAMDVSAGSGKELKSVTEALAKAQNGNLAGLGRLGIATKDAEGKTKSLGAITDDLSKKYSGAASAAANTASGQYARLSVMFHETAEAIGYKLLPYGIRLGNWIFNTGIPAAQKLGSWLKDHLGPAVSAVASWFKDGSAKGGDLSDAMKDLTGIVDDAKRAWVVLGPPIKAVAKEYLPALGTEIKYIVKGIRVWADTMIWMWNNVTGPTLRYMLNAFGDVNTAVGKMLSVLGHVPGYGWAKKLGTDLQTAGDKAHGLATQIRDIPKDWDVDINVTTHYSHMGRPSGGGGDPTDLVHPPTTARGGSGDLGTMLTGAQADLLQSVVAGISKVKRPGDKVLELVRQDYIDKKQKVNDLLQASEDFANSFKSWATSIFAMQSEDGAPLSIAQLLDRQHGEENQSGQVLSDVQKLLSLGLSKDLTDQLQAQGASGAAILHELAQADAATIAEFNRSNAQTQANYAAAGMAAAERSYAGQLAQAQAAEALAGSLTEAIAAFKNLEELTFILHGADLEAAIKADHKGKGKPK